MRGFMIVRCSECGNSFSVAVPVEGDIVACPVCEADYEAFVRDGQVRLRAYVYEGVDPGEL
ncbi:TPA: lysine biosynthesis protein LysW [Candidatus Bathyarchaeota archaeon]|nr:lysine biosynthesis protein LysW [Candidatus Bathyarchaeota archaeon]